MVTSSRVGLAVAAVVLLGGCTGATEGRSADATHPDVTHGVVSMTRSTWGGLCPEGPCRSELVVEPDGTWHYRAQDGQEQGRLDGAGLAGLHEAVRATALLEDGSPSTGCAADYDGRSVAYSWTIGDQEHRVDSCEVQIDPHDPLVVELEALFGPLQG